MEGVLELVQQSSNQLLHSVQVAGAPARDRTDQGVVAPDALSCLEGTGLVGEMRNVLQARLGASSELFLELLEVGTISVESSDSCDGVDKVLSGHVLDFGCDFMMYVVLEPLWGKIEQLCAVVQVADALPCKQSAFLHEGRDLGQVVVEMAV